MTKALTILEGRAKTALRIARDWRLVETERAATIASVRQETGARIVRVTDEEGPNYPALICQHAQQTIDEHQLAIRREDGATNLHVDAIAAWRLVIRRRAFGLDKLTRAVDLAHSSSLVAIESARQQRRDERKEQ